MMVGVDDNQNPSYSSSTTIFNDDDDNRGLIYDKINYVFGYVCNKLNAIHGGVLVQFWAPEKVVEEEDDGRCTILSTFDRPFGQSNTDINTNNNILAYRQHCIPYHHTIVNYSDDINMKMAPAATAFLNHLPELIMDLRSAVDHQGCSLLAFALKSGFTCCLFMPVFNRSDSSCCIGVVECCMMKQSSKALLLVFSYLKYALETLGLTTFNVQQFHPYEIICGLKHATNEVDVALEIVCESHHLTLAQVWISYENENHVLFSSDIPTKQKFALRLIGYSVDSDDSHLFSSLMDYHDTCETLPLKIGQGLAGRTLQIHQPLFYRNVSELSDSGPLLLLPANSKCSCLTICLRSTHTGDLDYAFEFIWPQRRHYLILLESLLLTLKQCLPSFRFCFGGKLGDKLRVFDVENSTQSTFTCFHLFQENKLPGLPKTLLGRKRPVAKECTSPLELKCKTTISIPLSLNGVKQKFGSTMLDDATILNEGRRQNVSNSITINGDKGVRSKSRSKRSMDSVSIDLAKNLKVSPTVGITMVKLGKHKVCQDARKVVVPEKECNLIRIRTDIARSFKLIDAEAFKLMYLDKKKYWITMKTEKHLKTAIYEMGLELEVGFEDM